MLGHPEVFTNIKLIEISTLPFELRKKNTAKIDKNGDVIDDSQHHPPDAFANGPPMQRLHNQNNIPLYQYINS